MAAVLSAATRAMLDRYALASRAVAHVGGDRRATEAGQSVEFHDFREYQPGDELRYVDWRVYARTGRLYTRLYEAERSVRLHLLLDESASMGLLGKFTHASLVVQLLSYVAQRDAPTQVHLLASGAASHRAQGMSGLLATWQFLAEAQPRGPTTANGSAASGPITDLLRFATALPRQAGKSLVIVVSDLLQDAPLQPALAALRARGLDACFVQVMASEELEPQLGAFELQDVESSHLLPVGSDEAAAYRDEVANYVREVRASVIRAGFRHHLLRVESVVPDEKEALLALVRLGILARR